MARNNWTREELIVAFNLYCKTPFTKINASNKGIKDLAKIIGRSDPAVALKLANFARLDPALKGRNISGMKHGSKEEENIWNEFNANWDDLSWQSEIILAKYKNDSVENISEISKFDLPSEGIERAAIVKVRVNQYFFRKTILASYDNRCCISGIAQPELLVASHIIPWSVDASNRMNPSNGLCLNGLYDKAFDVGLITVLPDYRIKLSKKIKENKNAMSLYFGAYDNETITLPQKFYPKKEFLEFHNEHVFRDRE